jgi:quinoprotein glucose dehydrogenase
MLAAIALGKAGNPADIPALVAVLEKNADQDAYLRHGAIQGLKTIVEKSGKVDALGKFAKHTSTAVRRGLVITLRQLKHRAISVFLNDADASIAIETIQAINDAYIEDARADLANATQWLGKSTPQIDQRIINAIYRVGGDANLKKILQLVSDEKQTESVRTECLFVLRRWENPPVADPTTGQVRPISGNRSIASSRPELSRTLQHLLETISPNLLADVILATETLNVPVDPKAMLMHFDNPKKPAAIRLAALKNLLHTRAPQLATALHKAVDDGDREVRVQSFAAMCQLDPDRAILQAKKILASTQGYDRQQLFASLATMPSPKAAAFILTALRDLKKQSPVIQLDILDAAEKRKEPEIVKALADYNASHDAKDLLASYRVTIEGGDIAKGRKIFYNHGAAECSRCHAAEKHRVGGNAGPNLADVGTLHARDYLMESLVNPGAKIAAGYGLVSITLKDGKTIGGKLMKEDDKQMEIADLVSGKSQSYPKAEIKDSTLPMSTMPPMGGMLTKQEMRDLIAYLSSMRATKK